MKVTKELMPNGELESIRSDNADKINQFISHYKNLEDQINHLQKRQKEQEQAIIKNLPYKPGDIIEVFYPNKSAGTDHLRLLNIKVCLPNIDFYFEIIEYRKDGQERKKLRKIILSHEEFSRMDKTIDFTKA